MSRMTVADEREAGRAARTTVPRSAHAAWEPPSDRSDPVEVLTGQDATRSADLVPLRHGRMSASAFTFYRGAAAIMAADLATTPTSGLEVQLCGDAHLSNLGVFATPERNLIFDLNDFDETLPGPWEWDLKRLATSFVVAARDGKMPSREARAAARACARAYREAMAGFADLGLLETWYSRLDVDQVQDVLSSAASTQARKQTRKQLAKARRRTSAQAVEKLTERVDGELRIRLDPPVVVPLRDIVGETDPEVVAERVRAFFAAYRDSLPDDRRFLLSQYEVVDMAHKVVGVGSVGTRAFIVLLRGRSDSDPLVLQFKEASASVLEPHLGTGPYVNAGQRVVEGQRMMQAASDIFLGWSASEFDGRHYYWRQLRDMKGSADVAAMTPKALQLYARFCGWSLARAHARSGSPAAIAGYLGGKEAFDDAITAFSQAYADQNEADYRAHTEAIADGWLEATVGD